MSVHIQYLQWPSVYKSLEIPGHSWEPACSVHNCITTSYRAKIHLWKRLVQQCYWVLGSMESVILTKETHLADFLLSLAQRAQIFLGCMKAIIFVI